MFIALAGMNSAVSFRKGRYFKIEGFFTKLSDPFVLTAPVEDPKGSGYLIQTRVNGSGAKVYGGTLKDTMEKRVTTYGEYTYLCQVPHLLVHF